MRTNMVLRYILWTLTVVLVVLIFILVYQKDNEANTFKSMTVGSLLPVSNCVIEQGENLIEFGATTNSSDVETFYSEGTFVELKDKYSDAMFEPTIASLQELYDLTIEVQQINDTLTPEGALESMIGTCPTLVANEVG